MLYVNGVLVVVILLVKASKESVRVNEEPNFESIRKTSEKDISLRRHRESKKHSMQENVCHTHQAYQTK